MKLARRESPFAGSSIAMVAFLAATALSDDVTKKMMQSRDGLARAVRIRQAFAPEAR